MQERATQTRKALARAAAHEFDRHGYAASSMTEIARAAGFSVGALTFHFASKKELADAVRRDAHADTLPAVDQAAATEADPVQSVIRLTLTLADLLETQVSVRAAARLSREQPGCAPDWASAWTPALEKYLPSTPEATTGRGTDHSALALLATYLVTGTEAEIRRRACRQEQSTGQAKAELARIWNVVLQGLATTGPDDDRALPHNALPDSAATPATPAEESRTGATE
ncbi:TetR family transcriptional regulator [Streptomyces sp. NPDC059063]|uniref:TetR family transcriptional regulator n=1 Tax=unclassified Streptomyces TaxID=2593676 RepID=UPI00369F0A01